MGETSHVLGVKILRDRSRKLLGLSQETYIKTMGPNPLEPKP
ncbi:hypothetical protein CsSME_00030803 [Camellia sinensis var. sinensis]